MRIKTPGKIMILLVLVAVAVGAYRYFSPILGKSVAAKSDAGFSDVVINDSKAVAKRPIRVALNSWPGFVGGLVANNGLAPTEDSLFWKYGAQVEFKIMEDPVAMRNEFAAGRVDVIWECIDTAAIAFPGLYDSNVNPKVFMQVDWSEGGDGIVGTRAVGSNIESLKGKRVGLLKQSPSDFFLMYMLQNSSLSTSEQKQVLDNAKGMDSPDQLREGIINGDFDAVVTWEPNISNIVSAGADKGIHRVIDTSTANRAVSDVFVASEEYIKNNPEAIKAFIRGWMDGVRKANANKQAAAKVLMANMPFFAELGEQKTMQTFSQVRLTGMADNARTFGFGGDQPQFDLIFNEASNLYKKQGVLDNRLPASKAKSDGLIRQLYASLDPEDKVVSPVVENVPTESERTKVEQEIKSPNFKPALTKRVTIHYSTGSATLSAAAKREIDEQIVPLLKVNANSIVSIEGNTDSVGDRSSNVQLSGSRASAVMKFLVFERGFPKEMFLVDGNGPDAPVASNATADGRALNRRTDIKVVAK